MRLSFDWAQKKAEPHRRHRALPATSGAAGARPELAGLLRAGFRTRASTSRSAVKCRPLPRMWASSCPFWFGKGHPQQKTRTHEGNQDKELISHQLTWFPCCQKKPSFWNGVLRPSVFVGPLNSLQEACGFLRVAFSGSLEGKPPADQDKHHVVFLRGHRISTHIQQFRSNKVLSHLALYFS